jgi:DNA-3-methyladenine glycosylase II
MTLGQQIETAEDYLAGIDPTLGQLIKLQRPIVWPRRTDYFIALTRAIVGQQISTHAAAAIYGRLDAATGMDPVKTAALTDDELRAIGLSRQKITYIRDLATQFADNPHLYDHMDKLPDDEVIQKLTAIKGIGEWSAQLFLMFTLIRLDVFAPDDIGLQRAIKTIYKFNTPPTKKDFVALADTWRPYRTVASWHLWKSLHNTPA